MSLPAHSRLGASSSKRWLSCAGSFLLAEALNKDGHTSIYAETGTLAHEVAQHCLRAGIEAWEYNKPLDDVNILAVAHYLLFIESLRKKHVEAHVPYVEEVEYSAQINKYLRGTIDHLLMSEIGIWVTDYKNGTGVFVDVENNEQLMYYAALAILETGVRHDSLIPVTLTIVQPNYTMADPVRSWATSTYHIMNWWTKVVLKRVDYLLSKPSLSKNDFEMGEHCKFCPVMLECPKMNRLYKDFMGYSGMKVAEISDNELSEIFENVDYVSMFIKEIKISVEGRLLSGRIIPSAKLVKKRAADRLWKEGVQEILFKHLGADIYTAPELKSPAQISKIVGGKALAEELAYSPQNNGYAVASINDKRPAIAIEAVNPNMFEGLPTF